METTPEQPVDEIRQLRRCVSDLVSILALPAMWSGSGPSQVVDTLLDTLLGMLDLDFVYVRLKDATGDAPIEAVKIGRSLLRTARVEEVGRILGRSFDDDSQKWPGPARMPLGGGDFAVLPLQLGLHGKGGMVITGSRRADFPKQTERLLLGVAVNQAAIGLQEALALRQSEERYRVVVETANEAIISVDESGKILFANPTAADVFGHSVAELMDKPVTMLMTEPFHPLRRSELTGRHKDGGEFPMEVSFGEVVKDGHRTFTGCIRDITERKKAEAALAARAQQAGIRADISAAFAKGDKLGAILNSCTEAIVRHLDAAFARIWTLDEGDNALVLQASAGLYTRLNGTHARVPVGELKIGRIAEEGKPHLTNDVPNDERVSDRDWAKREGMVAFAGYPLFVEGRVTGVLAMFARHPLSRTVLDALESVADIIAHGIDRRNAEHKLRKTLAELAHVTRLTTIGELAASISHEVNQPLGAVVANANACLRWLEQRPPKLEEAQESVRQIILDGNRGSDVVTGIRKLLRKEQPQASPLKVNDLVREIIVLLQAELREVTALTLLADGLPLVVADRGQLQQVLLNLIMNAIEAMKAVSDRPRVLRIETSLQMGNMILVAIQDSGSGLDATQMQKLFESFYTTKPQGLGMGLSIGRSIIERHGGRLWAESNEGPGATFKFSLPGEEGKRA